MAKSQPVSKEDNEREHRESLDARYPGTTVNNPYGVTPDHPVLELDHAMDFGKYRYETLDYVIETDIQYITWMLTNTARTISDEAYHVYNQMIQSRKSK